MEYIPCQYLVDVGLENFALEARCPCPFMGTVHFCKRHHEICLRYIVRFSCTYSVAESRVRRDTYSFSSSHGPQTSYNFSNSSAQPRSTQNPSLNIPYTPYESLSSIAGHACMHNCQQTSAQCNPSKLQHSLTPQFHQGIGI